MHIKTGEKLKCYHCGDECADRSIYSHEKVFCCDGCKLVHQLLSENNLCTYYELESSPGVSLKARPFKGRYQFLDEPRNEQKLIQFSDGTYTIVVFHLPQVHCASCVWLLEHLYRLNKGIRSSRVDFVRREITVEFDRRETTLRQVAETLAMVGYEPALNLSHLESKPKYTPQRQRIYRLAVAGFCFSNIMLLSFPEYFALGEGSEASMQKMFGVLNLVLSLPVFLYSGSEFYISAWKGLRARFLNIDAPIALAIFITFGRSLFEIISGTGAGYLDSMSGIVFFMLIGRYFQDMTHGNLAFDRDYKSYFPIAITRIVDGAETETAVNELKAGDRIVVRSGEIVPCDCILFKGDAAIDYSFVNGESVPIKVNAGERIYAGGRQTGGAIELIAEKETSQSYLTGLWNKQAFAKEKTYATSFIHPVSRYFTAVLLVIAGTAFIYWLPQGLNVALNAFTAALIVACPCALLLSATFTNGSVMRVFSRNRLYLKNPEVIEAMSRTNEIVFDKTGTITETRLRKIEFHGMLSDYEKNLVGLAVAQSGHPLSRSILAITDTGATHPVRNFEEWPGRGLSASIDGHTVRIGSAEFAGAKPETHLTETRVYVNIDDDVLGYYSFATKYRNQLGRVLKSLATRARLSLVSGDHAVEAEQLGKYFGRGATMKFEQTPEQKMKWVEDLKTQGRHVMMIGDGLNDAGALQSSHVGVAISDDTNNFSPACDAILASDHFRQLPALLRMSVKARHIIVASFAISILYNLVGLYFAVTAQLHPVVAAVLMPASSLTIILFTTLSVWYNARRLGLGNARTAV